MFSKSTSKKTMTASVVSLVLCFVMLLGTTFAWFTTNASTSVNTIKSGSLSVDLVDENGATLVGKTVGFVNADDALWEPGCTYELEPVYVKNTGNLALKYKVEVIGVDGDAKLLDAIDWTINGIGDVATLEKGATSDAITIKGVMKETAGNQYQDLEADGIAICVTATQANVEADSIGTDYDKDATFAELTALVKTLEGEDKPADLDVAYAFKPVEDVSASEYKNYNADFVVSFDKDVAAKTLKLGGNKNDGNWQYYDNAAVSANEEIRLLSMMLGCTATYEEVSALGEFDCGVKANGISGTTMTVELRLYEVVNGVETGEYLIAGTYTYAF